MAPFNVEKFGFPNVYPTDTPTLKGANRHEHGCQVNFVPGVSHVHAAGILDYELIAFDGPGDAGEHADEHAAIPLGSLTTSTGSGPAC